MVNLIIPQANGSKKLLALGVIETKTHATVSREWSGSPDPRDPDNFWIDDETGERVNAHTGERAKAEV